MSESNDLVLTGYEHKSQGTEFYIVVRVAESAAGCAVLTSAFCATG